MATDTDDTKHQLCPGCPSKLLTAIELAEYLGVELATVYNWRRARTGPKASRVGKYLRYRRSDVDAWLLEQQSDRQH